MSDEHDEHDDRSARERGLAKMREVYGDVLSFRDRRLLAMGVIAANGATDIWGLQARSALANGELSVEELRETLVFLAPYAGYPNVAPLVGVTEKAIAGAVED